MRSTPEDIQQPGDRDYHDVAGREAAESGAWVADHPMHHYDEEFWNTVQEAENVETTRLEMELAESGIEEETARASTELMIRYSAVEIVYFRAVMDVLRGRGDEPVGNGNVTAVYPLFLGLAGAFQHVAHRTGSSLAVRSRISSGHQEFGLPPFAFATMEYGQGKNPSDSVREQTEFMKIWNAPVSAEVASAEERFGTEASGQLFVPVLKKLALKG